MAHLSISIPHGMQREVAQAHFRTAVAEARTQYLGWIERLDWTEDGHSATVAGPGFEVRAWCDERDLHIEGSIPFAWKLFEGALRSGIRRQMDVARITHNK
jgi:hypothetical protein